MDNTRIYTLYARKLSGEADQAELTELEQLIRSQPDDAEWNVLLTDAWASPAGKEVWQQNDIERLLQRQHTINTVEMPAITPVVKKRWYYSRWAAAALLTGTVLLTGGLFYFNSSLYTQVNVAKTKMGQRTAIILEDGTRVWLNSGSRLNRDRNFGKSNREVYLDGEAFFDVAANATNPFIIHAHKMDIKVLGTAFNVKSYRLDSFSEASLVRGKIEVTLKENNQDRKVMLKPNEKLSLQIKPAQQITSPGKTGTVAVDNLKVGQLTKLDNSGLTAEAAWKDNELVFLDEDLNSIAVKLEHWYGIKVQINDPEKINEMSKKITGVIKDESLEGTLDALKAITPFNYTIQGKQVLITR